MNSKHKLAKCAFVNTIVALCMAATPAMSNQAALEFENCQVWSGSQSLDAQCATMQRALDPTNPQSEKVGIFVAKFASFSPQPSEDAFTVIQGGPGMSSIDLFIQMENVFKSVRRERDVLVIDQRGTGRSNMLKCESFDAEAELDFDPVVVKQLTKDCLAELSSDPAFYTTSLAVDDLDAVRAAAGYKALSIYGVSYGTRVAQHYLRKYEQNTRAVILDGVADLATNLAGAEIAIRSQAAWGNLVQRCADDSACTEAYGDLQTKFEELRERLKQEPQELSLPHPISGKTVSQSVGEPQLLATIRLMPYTTESLALLPFFVDEAHKGNYIPLAAYAIQSGELFSEYYSYPMNNSVVCSEDAPFLTEADMRGHENTYFGSEPSQSMQIVCDLWPKGPVDENFRTPFDSAVPVMILSGETDPITPPENGEQSHQMLSNSIHIVVPAHGHGVVGRGCVAPLANDFINQGNFDEIKTQCVQRERALPFFLSIAGPNP